MRWVAGELERRFLTTDLVARYGGDEFEEFVVAFLNTTHPRIDERLEAARRGISSCALRTRSRDREMRVSVSIGAARFPGCGQTVHETLAVADERLYIAKKAGRDRVVVEGGSDDQTSEAALRAR